MVFPALAYPTYEVGARLAGARTLAADALTSVGPERVSLVWINSPSNPTGRVLPVEHLRKVVAWCRERGALLVSDECYLECAWETDAGLGAPPRRQRRRPHRHPRRALAVEAVQPRRLPLRASWPATRDVVGRAARRPQEPRPADARPAAGGDAGGARRRRARRPSSTRATDAGARCCAPPLEGAGFRVDHSEASLYLWATRDEPCWDTVGRLAERGILVAPGEFYGRAGARHVRVAFTATDERVAAAARGWPDEEWRASWRPPASGAAPAVDRGAVRRRREDADRGHAAHPDHGVLEVLGVQHHAVAVHRRHLALEPLALHEDLHRDAAVLRAVQCRPDRVEHRVAVHLHPACPVVPPGRPHCDGPQERRPSVGRPGRADRSAIAGPKVLCPECSCCRIHRFTRRRPRRRARGRGARAPPGPRRRSPGS